jgi:anti-sigma factor RsiW
LVRPTAVLRCYRTRRRIGAYLDGALDERDAARAGTHIAACGRCQGEVDSLRRLSAMLRRGLHAPVPADWTGFWEGIRRGIEAPRREPSVSTHPAWGWRPRFAVGAVAMLLLVVSVALWQMPRGAVTTGAGETISVTSADTDDPQSTVMVYSPPERDLAVVWLFTSD